MFKIMFNVILADAKRNTKRNIQVEAISEDDALNAAIKKCRKEEFVLSIGV